MESNLVLLAFLALAGCEPTAPAGKSSSSAAKSAASAPKSAAKPAASSAPASSGSAAVDAKPAPVDGPEIKVGPMKVTIDDGKKSTTIEMAADGSVRPTKPEEKDKGKFLKFVKNELQDETSKWLLRVTADNSVEVRETHREVSDGKVVSEKEEIKKVGTLKGDTIEGEKGGSFSINDKGEFLTTKEGGKPETMKEFKVEGVTAETKTAALLLVFGMFAVGTTEVSTGAAASAEPMLSAAPIAPAPSK